MTCGIYKVEALCPVAKLAGQAIYIGQSKNIERRWREHQRSRFPTDQYHYMVILEVPPEHDLNLLEKLFIDVYDSHRNGLNGTLGGTGFKVRFPSEERNKKLSEAKKGKSLSEEHKAAIRKGGTGRPVSEETRLKLSEARKGRKVSEEGRQNMSRAKKGLKRKPPTQEHTERIAASNRGRKRTPEQKQRMSEGRKKANEQRRAQLTGETINVTDN